MSNNDLELIANETNIQTSDENITNKISIDVEHTGNKFPGEEPDPVKNKNIRKPIDEFRYFGSEPDPMNQRKNIASREEISNAYSRSLNSSDVMARKTEAGSSLASNRS